MRLLLFVLAALCISTMSCKQQAEPSDVIVDAAADTLYTVFGASLTPDDALSLGQVIEKIDTENGYAGKMTGTVEDVCQAKGCWMNIVADGVADTMVGKFKDYGFFMPKDIAGKEVIMNGEAYYEETSVEELRHYAEDAGASAEDIAAITEPEKTLKFMADGVLLVK